MEIIARGTNRPPLGIAALPERCDTNLKYDYFEHAERAAIMAAARAGCATDGALMVVPWFACVDCAKAIIGAGIRSVVGHAPPCQSDGPWSESIAKGLRLFDEAGVSYRYVEEHLGVEGVRFAGVTYSR